MKKETKLEPILKGIDQGKKVPIPRGGSVELLRFSGDDALARDITITLQTGLFDQAISLTGLVADIIWGVGGFQCKTTVDFIHGQRVTVNASSVQVIGRNLSEDFQASSIEMGAFAAYGSAPKAKSPIRTTSEFIEEEGQILSVSVEPFAKSFYSYATTGPQSILLMGFGPPLGIIIHALMEFEEPYSGILPIPAGTQLILVRNDSEGSQFITVAQEINL